MGYFIATVIDRLQPATPQRPNLPDNELGSGGKPAVDHTPTLDVPSMSRVDDVVVRRTELEETVEEWQGIALPMEVFGLPTTPSTHAQPQPLE